MKKTSKSIASIYSNFTGIFSNFFFFIKLALWGIYQKKSIIIPLYTVIGYFFFVSVMIQISGCSSYDKVLTNKRINDVTKINPVYVSKIIRPTATEEIIEAIKSSTGPISIGGGKFSQGGQTAFENSLHIDMRSFNKIIALDTVNKQITVQSGVIWRDLQKFVDPFNFSVKIMQTYADFTVGGSISVNCHGRYIGYGPIISSVLSLKIITASGEEITANRTENYVIFKAVVGGYGGIGVITEATLQLADNVKVERKTVMVNADGYRDFFNKNIRDNKEVVFQNGDLYPPDFNEVNSVYWLKSEKELTDTVRVNQKKNDYLLEKNAVQMVSWGHFGKWLRRSVFDPVLYNSEKVVWRNNEASYDVNELEPESREKDTYVLQEYFIPVGNINSFIPKMKSIYDKYDVNVMNVSLRHALPDSESYLAWAKDEVFAFVIYYKQGTDDESKEIVKKWTVEMTDAILSENGRWYLPYQPHASIEQFQKGYPGSDKYFEIKKKIDPENRFNNKLLDKYNPNLKANINHKRNEIKGYFRPEDQTVLTVPEWYLVYNPKEYSDYLESGKNPSAFPFYSSVDEYWTLYSRSMKLVSEAYPENDEYKTMLRVIGTSVTLEYSVKMIYENTAGRFFGLFAEDSISAQEKTIIKANRAYSDFIYDTAWYEFKFLPWIGKVWSETDSSKSSFFRKWERTLFFTTEFTGKAFYAQLIQWAAQASYEPPVTDIYLLVSMPDSIPKNPALKIIEEENGKKIIGIKRWGAFTETMLGLTDQNIEIFEIGGNDEIAVSVILEKSKSVDFKDSNLLYESRIVTKAELKREVYILPVNELLPFIRYSKMNNYNIEHIYDY